MAANLQVIEQQQTMNQSLSLIENLNVAQVSQVIQKISQFQAIVQKTLREGHDYGIIPGTGGKPTLLKPGAEKILMLMGVTSEYELIERIQDYENGFFAYTIRCVLSRNGQVITQGVGHCNNREKKYRSEKQDPFTLANTCLKMAKKRAQIDAVLTIASLSEVFTQDIEDMDFEPEAPRAQQQRQQRASNTGGVSDAQIKYIHKLKTDKNIPDDDFRRIISELTEGKTSTKDLTKKEASELINFLNNYPAQQPQEPQPNDIDDSDLPF
jgi:hypothetical protein